MGCALTTRCLRAGAYGAGIARDTRSRGSRLCEPTGQAPLAPGQGGRRDSSRCALAGQSALRADGIGAFGAVAALGE